MASLDGLVGEVGEEDRDEDEGEEGAEDRDRDGGEEGEDDGDSGGGDEGEEDGDGGMGRATRRRRAMDAPRPGGGVKLVCMPSVTIWMGGQWMVVYTCDNNHTIIMAVITQVIV